MNKIISMLSLAAFSFVFMACSSEIPDGSSTAFDQLPDKDKLYGDAMVKKNYLPLNHPCMLHSAADIARVKGSLTSTPWAEAWTHLQASPYAQASYTDNTSALGADGLLKRMDTKNWSGTYSDYSNYTGAMRDAAACYQLALRYQLSGDEQYAATAVKVLNAWKDKCKGILKVGGYTDSIADPNLILLEINAHQFANAAELLRSYDRWAQSDFEAFCSWMKSTYVPVAKKFLTNHLGNQGTQHYWLNWDLACMTSILSIGILCDDNELINWGINYYNNEDKVFNDPGNCTLAIPYIHKDPDSSEELGQCEESGRDQGHATLCVALLGALCQMANNVGEDLFAYDDYRALKMAEYVGKYNLLTDAAFPGVSTSNQSSTLADSCFTYDSATFPYTSYTNASYSCPTVSATYRGTKRPCWELFYCYAKSKGLSAIYCQKWSEQQRTLSGIGCDGGAGDYGPNSGGFDQSGWGTLMYAR